MADFIEVLILPLRRVVVFLWSLQVGNTTLGSLIMIGILFSILIAILTHSHGFDFGHGINKLGDDK